MIEFKTGRKQATPLIFANVEQEQFFIDAYGSFCQKTSNREYTVIANSSGEPYSAHEDAYAETEVLRILPRVTKITFPGMEG